MAFMVMNTEKLGHNYTYLDNLFSKHHIMWAVVTKVLCGNKLYLSELLKLGVKQVCDSRLTNLKNIKLLDETIETIYIKPPSHRNVSKIVQYADISVNTEIETIKSLSRSAKKQNKSHKILIMIEMGELREGVMREDFIKFFKTVFTKDNIEVIGIGTNFSCLYGVLPTQDKLIQLSLYEQLIEAKFNVEIPFVSGGSSVVIPLIFNGLLPKGINHFRVGETLFLGSDVYNNQKIPDMHQDIFKLYAEIIELIEKPNSPSGQMGTNVEGESFDFQENIMNDDSYRAILDLGLLDVDEKHIWCSDTEAKFAGASSDMMVLDLDANPNNYKVGDLLEFDMDYMGLLRLMNSEYIEKKIK